MATWRDIARPIIYQVILKNPGCSIKELQKLISKEYPFGERKYHPYKIWLDEVKIQLRLRKWGKRNIKSPKEQMKLF